MSLVLTSSGEKLEITAATVIPFTVHYADYVGATPMFTPGVVAGDTINGTRDLLAAPASGQSVIRTISVHNDSGGPDTVTIQLDDAAVNYTIVTVALPDDCTLYYDEDGWKVLDASGAVATTLFAHTILGPHHSDTTTDAVTRGSLIYGNATPEWDEWPIGGAHQILKVTTGGLDIEWASFDWDSMAAAAAADMVHDHSAAGEGGTALGPLASVSMLDTAWLGIAGNELLTVNAAGNFTFSGITSLVVPDGCWIGADANAGIVFNTTASTVSVLDKFGFGIAAPDYPVHVYTGDSGHAGVVGVNYDELVLEGAGNVGMTLLMPDADHGAYAFESVTSGAHDNKIRWQYNAGNELLDIIVGGTSVAMFTDTGFMGLGKTPTDFIDIEGATSPRILITDTTNTCEVMLQAADTIGYTGTRSNHAFHILTNNTNRIVVANGGSVTIGNLGGGGAQDVGADNNGLLYVPFVSDRKFKSNIKPLSGGLEAILALRGVTFDWNKEALADVGLDFGDPDQQVGLIAQEVVEVIPQARSDGKEYQSYRRDMIVPYLVKAIQEQQAQIEALQAQLVRK